MKRRTDGRKEKDRLDVTFPAFLIFLSRPVLVSTKSISTTRLYTVSKYDFKRNHLNVWFLVYAISRQQRRPRSLRPFLFHWKSRKKKFRKNEIPMCRFLFNSIHFLLLFLLLLWVPSYNIFEAFVMEISLLSAHRRRRVMLYQTDDGKEKKIKSR